MLTLNELITLHRALIIHVLLHITHRIAHITQRLLHIIHDMVLVEIDILPVL